ncbi:MAG: amidohydrolase [SAR202 cluster bacterium]|nr:amidohydrolase [SAR202 cluster bacterium]|tara:strand:- start:598 stop:1608 length:1011 start_codon:yes stop_codon:yes gene_type:complete
MFDGMKVIDCHGHMTTPPGFRAAIANWVSQNTGPSNHGSFPELSDEAMANANQRHLDMLDDHSIDYQLISPRPIAMWHWMRPHLQYDWAHFTNDTISQIMRLWPERFGGIAQLPQNRDLDGSHLVDELERTVKTMGFVGALVNPDPGGDRLTPGMNEKYWYPLYEKAQELNAVLMIHPSVSYDKRWEIVPANYQMNNVVEEYIAMQLLEHGRVFDDFPNLKVFICHGGGALHRFIKEDYHRGNRDLSNNLWFDSCVLERNVLEAMIKQKTPQQVLFGTEAPGSGGAKRPESGLPSDDLVPVIGDMDFLSAEDKKDIFRENIFRAVPLLDPNLPGVK